MKDRLPVCPRCGSRWLIEDAEPDLFSCHRCMTWLRRSDGILLPTAVSAVDTASLPLPWRRAEKDRI